MTLASEATLTALVADDEPLARSKIRDFLTEVPGVSCVGEARSGPETVAMVNRLRPDVLFLDVRMPGLDGLQVLRHLQHNPVVVFTTAHDDHAVAAFEARALDYLVKPFGRARFLEAVRRAREARPLRQIFVRIGRRIQPVEMSSVTRFQAADDYVAIHANGKELLAAIRMDELETFLDPVRFLRIHRSHIVNLGSVASIMPHSSGRLAVTMRDGTTLLASRARSRDVRRRTV